MVVMASSTKPPDMKEQYNGCGYSKLTQIFCDGSSPSRKDMCFSIASAINHQSLAVLVCVRGMTRSLFSREWVESVPVPKRRFG